MKALHSLKIIGVTGKVRLTSVLQLLQIWPKKSSRLMEADLVSPSALYYLLVLC